MRAFIKGISYYLPKSILTNEKLSDLFPEWDAEKVASKVGVRARHISGTDETAGDMAEKVAHKLFAEYEVSPKEIDFLLLCTQSPDYLLPSTSCILQDRLGIPTSAGAFDFNLGCSGSIYGLAIAKGLVSSGMANNVLLLTAETYTKYLHPEDKGSRSIFGDGAAACLVSNQGFADIGEFVLGTDGSGADNLIIKTGGARNRMANGNQTEDEEGRIRRDDFLYMNGGNIFNFTLDVVPPMINEVLKKNMLVENNIDFYLFHQANKFMLNALRKVARIPKEKFYIDLENTGNTVPSTVLIGLKDSIENGVIQPGMNVMIAGFGVGLSWGGTILRIK